MITASSVVPVFSFCTVLSFCPSVLGFLQIGRRSIRVIPVLRLGDGCGRGGGVDIDAYPPSFLALTFTAAGGEEVDREVERDDVDTQLHVLHLVNAEVSGSDESVDDIEQQVHEPGEQHDDTAEETEVLEAELDVDERKDVGEGERSPWQLQNKHQQSAEEETQEHECRGNVDVDVDVDGVVLVLVWWWWWFQSSSLSLLL